MRRLWTPRRFVTCPWAYNRQFIQTHTSRNSAVTITLFSVTSFNQGYAESKHSSVLKTFYYLESRFWKGREQQRGTDRQSGTCIHTVGLQSVEDRKTWLAFQNGPFPTLHTDAFLPYLFRNTVPRGHRHNILLSSSLNGVQHRLCFSMELIGSAPDIREERSPKDQVNPKRMRKQTDEYLEWKKIEYCQNSSTILHKQNGVNASIHLRIVRHLRIFSYAWSTRFLSRNPTPHNLSRLRD